MLDIQTEFTITLITIDEHSLAFEAWHKNVFLTQNSGMKDDFEFGRWKSDEGLEVIEVASCNPAFSLDALYELFRMFNETSIKSSISETKRSSFN